MTSPAWHHHNQLGDMGYSPDDIESDNAEPPTCITVNYLAPVQYRDFDTGEIVSDPTAKAGGLREQSQEPC